MSEHRILLISTGGTIAGEVATKKIANDYEIRKADAFSDLIRDTLIYIRKEKGIDVDIKAHEFSEVDSSDIKPSHWTGLADFIHDKYDDYDSFIITHGTNTLGYSCAALAFAFLNNKKPIVLTGSQVPIGVPGSDAQTNLDNAIRVACWQDELYGVVAVFGSHIISGTRVKKATEFDYDAFQSFNTGGLGRIGRIIDMNTVNLKRHNKYRKTSSYNHASSKEFLKVESNFCTDICSLTEFPGMDPNIFKYLVNNAAIKGFVLRAFGAGDPAETLHEGLEFLKEKEIPIVITTQAPNGNANMQVNKPGQYIKEHKLGIPAYDMSIESQITKLAWLLAKKQAGTLSYELLCQEMTKDVRGEVNVMWEDED